MQLLTHQLYVFRGEGVSAILCLTVGPSILLILVMDLLINWQERPALLEMEFLTPMSGVTWWLNYWGSLGAASKPKPFFFLVSEDPDHLTNLASEDSWERQIPVRLINQKDI